MKTSSLLFAIASTVLISLPSCKKNEQEKQPIAETVNTTVKVNETYSYTLPSTDSPEPFTVVKQSEHSGVSVIEKNAAGNFVYSYTPFSNFSGSDVVVISNERDGGPCDHPGCNHQNCGHNKPPRHGNCNHNHNDQKHIITINFTIQGSGVETSTAVSK